MKKKQAPGAASGSWKNLLSKRTAGWPIAVALGVLGFVLAFQVAGPDSLASENDEALTDGRITVQAGDWYGKRALFFEITGEHSNIAFGYLANPKKQICETVTGVRYWDLYNAPTRPDPIYDENGVFTGQFEDLDPARQSGSYKRVKGGTRYLCLRVIWGDYREEIGYGSFYGPFSYETGLLVETGEETPPPQPVEPPPAFSLLTGQSHSPDGTKIRVTATRYSGSSAAIVTWQYLVADADKASIAANKDCRALFEGESGGSVLVAKRNMTKDGTNSAYADIAPQYSANWACLKAVNRDDDTVYAFVRLIDHQGGGQEQNQQNGGGQQMQNREPVPEPDDTRTETNTRPTDEDPVGVSIVVDRADNGDLNQNGGSHETPPVGNDNLTEPDISAAGDPEAESTSAILTGAQEKSQSASDNQIGSGSSDGLIRVVGYLLLAAAVLVAAMSIMVLKSRR